MHRITTLLVFLLLLQLPLFSNGSVEEQQLPIRIGILPDADSLPLMVAEASELFDAYQTAIELVRFQSPVERDAAFQAGRIDGFIGDTLSALLLEAAGIDITITSDTRGRYGIAASPASGITDLAGLSGRPIAISTNTIIEYSVSALFEYMDLERKLIETIAVPKIPVRMELLLQNSVPAACLPEPLYSLVIARGAAPILDTTVLNSSPGVLIFSSDVLRGRADELKGFYRAYFEAGNLIDSDPEAFRDFLIETAGFPEPVKESYEFVTYGRPHIPSEREVLSVASWMVSRGLIDDAGLIDELFDSSWDLGFLNR